MKILKTKEKKFENKFCDKKFIEFNFKRGDYPLLSFRLVVWHFFAQNIAKN